MHNEDTETGLMHIVSCYHSSDLICYGTFFDAIVNGAIFMPIA